MAFFTWFAMYFIVWWVCLFAVLPFGIRGQHQDGPVTDGTEPGAPVRTHLLIKMVATSILALVVLLLAQWGLSNETLQAYWNR